MIYKERQEQSTQISKILENHEELRIHQKQKYIKIYSILSDQILLKAITNIKKFKMESKNYVSLAGQNGLTTDQALNLVGSNGRYQKVHGALYIFLATILSGAILFGLAFLQDLHSLQLTCQKSSGITQKCSRNQACNTSISSSYTVDWNKSKHNFVTDFGFICSSDVLISLQGTTCFAGFMLGCLLWFPLSDKINKKYVILINYFIHLIIFLLVFIFKGQWIIFLFLFIFGFQIPGTNNVVQILMLEYVSVEARSWYLSINYAAQGVMIMFLPLYYKYTNSWMYLFILSEVLTIIGIFMFLFYFKPSPRELIAKGRYNEARVVLDNIAKWNNKPPFKGVFKHQETLKHTEAVSNICSVDQNIQKKSLLKRLCQSNKLTVRVIFLSFLWFTLNLVYYGISFGLGKLQGDIYVNGIISGASEALAYLISGLLMTFVGRRQLSFASFLITGIPLCFYSFIHGHLIVSYIMVLVSKFGISSCFNVVVIWSVQLFPTEVKGTAFAFCNFFGRIGGILAPFISGVMPRWFLLVFGVLSITAASIAIMLAETKGQIIPDVIQDAVDEPTLLKVKDT